MTTYWPNGVDEFPEMAPVESMPLHSGGVDFAPGEWGCATGERAPNFDARYDWRCPGCVAAAEATIPNRGDRFFDWCPHPGEAPLVVRLSWLIARSRYWGVR